MCILRYVKTDSAFNHKTHKSLEIAKLQVELGGADGLICAKPSEALFFLDKSFNPFIKR
jgi:D-serine deaminase-like pyridoxal phosphate-dependent protein